MTEKYDSFIWPFDLSNARITGCRKGRDFCGSYAKNRDAYGSPSACDCYTFLPAILLTSGELSSNIFSVGK
jgi:hypothetical protein